MNISETLFTASLAIRKELEKNPNQPHKNEILDVVDRMKTLQVNLEIVPVITDSLAESEPVNFEEKRPENGESILVVINDGIFNHFYLGYYSYTTYHNVLDVNGEIFESFTDDAKWVKSTKTLEELGIDYLIR